VELNILYYVIIRVDCNDERARGVAHEHDTRPSYDENVTNIRTHAHTQNSIHVVRFVRLPTAADFKGQQNG
jgi:hypothetical protein